MTKQSPAEKKAADLLEGMGVRQLPVPVEKTFKFGRDQVVEALKYLASGQHIGKICIDF